MFNIFMCSQEHEILFMECSTEAEAIEVCEDYGWKFEDENGFCWRLEIR